jgi:uncharacterized protein (DUF2141 family)
MKKDYLFLFISIILALSFVTMNGCYADDGNLNITITGLKNSDGVVRGALFKSSDGFPFQSEKAVKTFCTPIADNRASITLHKIPYGTYAICVYHDEKNQNKLELGFLGKPKQGVGFSKNPPKKHRAPGFDQTRFDLNSAEIQMDIVIVYY